MVLRFDASTFNYIPYEEFPLPASSLIVLAPPFSFLLEGYILHCSSPVRYLLNALNALNAQTVVASSLIRNCSPMPSVPSFLITFLKHADCVQVDAKKLVPSVARRDIRTSQFCKMVGMVVKTQQQRICPPLGCEGDWGCHELHNNNSLSSSLVGQSTRRQHVRWNDLLRPTQ